MSSETGPTATLDAAGRIEALDVARGIALIAMAIYHFTWDLDHFGYVARGLATDGGWRIFARCIASAFLVLVGFGLFLAHRRAIRWRPFLKRLSQVAAGALAITLVTAYVTPNSFVFFGILHNIAAASLLGLLFLRLPWLAIAVLAVVVVAAPLMFRTALTDPKWLTWIGFSATPPVANDFVPLFPWFGAVLAGIAAAQLLDRRGAMERLRATNPALARLRPVAALGRHSLAVYLLHQPLLFGLVLLASEVAPPDRTALVESDCRQNAFLGERSAESCAPFAACAVSELKAESLLEAALDGSATPDQDATIRSIVNQCAMTP